MKRRSRYWIIGLAVLAVSVPGFWFLRAILRNTSSSERFISEPNQASTATSEGGLQSKQQISLKDKTHDEAMQVWWKRRERDQQADWKIPISFYGHIIDQNKQPVASARVHFQWTDLSRHGTSERETFSDNNGNFYLSGVQGKNLGVRITKEGYYTPNKAKAAAFEFADPGERNYYEPDPRNPVTFTLRKRGVGEPLLKKSAEVVLSGDGSSASLDLATGKTSATGQLQIRSWKPWPPRPMSPPYDWKVELTIPDGGFIETNEEFALEAPQQGYERVFEVSMPANAGNGWRLSAERTVYFSYGEPKMYGRLKLRTDGNSRYVFLDYVLNPTGSRNLEEAASRRSGE